MALPKYVVIAGVLVLSGLTLAEVTQVCMVPASDDTKSVFLRSFNPTEAVKQCVNVIGTGSGASAGAGDRAPWSRRPVTHSADFEWRFRPDPAGYARLMPALLWVVQGSLSSAHATITYQQIDNERFVILYRCGRSTGRIQVEPPQPAENSSTDYHLTLHVEEKWAVTG